MRGSYKPFKEINLDKSDGFREKKKRKKTRIIVTNIHVNACFNVFHLDVYNSIPSRLKSCESEDTKTNLQIYTVSQLMDFNRHLGRRNQLVVSRLSY